MGDGDRYGAVAREKRLFWIALYCIRWRLGGVLQTRFCRFVNLQSFFFAFVGAGVGWDSAAVNTAGGEFIG